MGVRTTEAVWGQLFSASIPLGSLGMAAGLEKKVEHFLLMVKTWNPPPCLHRVCDVAGCFDTELLDYLDAQLPNQALESKERHPPRGHSISSFFLQLAVGGATSPGKAPL